MGRYAYAAIAAAAEVPPGPSDWPPGWPFPGPPWPPGFEDGTGMFSTPSPADDATAVDVDDNLSWAFSLAGATYEVMLNGVVVGTSSSAAYALDTLTSETAYTWRVFATVGAITYVSPEWSFTTEGVNWTLVQTLASTLGGYFGIHAIHDGASGDGIIFATGGASGDVGKIYKSSDDGVSFSEVLSQASVASFSDICNLGSGVLLAMAYRNKPVTPAGRFHVWRSLDYGTSWSYFSSGGGSLYTFDGTCLCNLGGGVILAGASGSSLNGYKCVYKSTDFGATWNNDSSGGVALGYSQTACIALLNIGGGVVLASSRSIAGANPRVFRSVDSGASWSPVLEGNGGRYISRLLLDGSVVYAASMSSYVHVSSNGGVSWSQTSQADTSDNSGLTAHGSGVVLCKVGGLTGVYKSRKTEDDGATWVDFGANTDDSTGMAPKAALTTGGAILCVGRITGKIWRHE